MRGAWAEYTPAAADAGTLMCAFADADHLRRPTSADKTREAGGEITREPGGREDPGRLQLHSEGRGKWKFVMRRQAEDERQKSEAELCFCVYVT